MFFKGTAGARIAALEAELESTRLDRDRFRRLANGFTDFSEGPPKSNLSNWQALQDGGYFENHPNHRGLVAFDSGEVEIINHFRPMRASDVVVVIGCGYGRDVAQIAPHVAHVYGVDVGRDILAKAAGFLQDRGVANFTPVLAENYQAEIPSEIDLVFGFVVFQHLTRDLTRQYLDILGARLSHNGVFVGQFLETTVEDETLLDARLENYEPSVSWSVMQLHRLGYLTGLETREIKTVAVSGGAALWHWACFQKRR